MMSAWRCVLGVGYLITLALMMLLAPIWSVLVNFMLVALLWVVPSYRLRLGWVSLSLLLQVGFFFLSFLSFTPFSLCLATTVVAALLTELGHRYLTPHYQFSSSSDNQSQFAHWPTNAVLFNHHSGTILDCTLRFSALFGRERQLIIGQDISALLINSEGHYLTISTLSSLNQLAKIGLKLANTQVIESSIHVHRDIAPSTSALFFSEVLAQQVQTQDMDSAYAHATLSSIGDGVICTDVAGDITFMNPVAEAVLAKLTSEVRGTPFDDVVPLFREDTGKRITNFPQKCIRAKQTIGLPELTSVTNHIDLTFAVHDSISPIFGPKGQILGTVMVFQDVTLERMKNKAINHLAHHDALTDLPNRLLFFDRLSQACKRARRRNYQFAVVFIDMDHFKEVNDTLGHDFGDELLKSVSLRFCEKIRACDTVARLGGDEFVILLDAIVDKKDVAKVVKKVLDNASGLYRINRVQFQASFSAGIAIYPDDGESADVLLKHADAAMYKAKTFEGTTWQFYSTELDAIVEQRVKRLQEIEAGIERHEFLPFIQPVVNAHTFVIEKLEVLARWKNEGEYLPPESFIELAEDSGVIDDMFDQVWEQAIVFFKTWLAIIPDLKLSFNLSGLQVIDQAFLRHFSMLIERENLPANLIELELSEVTLVQNLQNAAPVLAHLREHGVKVTIDRFGVGQTGFTYLQQVKFDALKIDRSFVSTVGGLTSQEGDITPVIVNVAHSLGVDCVAVGVENAEQARILAELGCDYLQGYYFAKPMKPEQIEELLRDQSGHFVNSD